LRSTHRPPSVQGRNRPGYVGPGDFAGGSAVTAAAAGRAARPGHHLSGMLAQRATPTPPPRPGGFRPPWTLPARRTDPGTAARAAWEATQVGLAAAGGGGAVGGLPRQRRRGVRPGELEVARSGAGARAGRRPATPDRDRAR